MNILGWLDDHPIQKMFIETQCCCFFEIIPNSTGKRTTAYKALTLAAIELGEMFHPSFEVQGAHVTQKNTWLL